MINKKLFGRCLYKAENSQLLKRKISSYAGMQADKLCQQISLFENDEIIAEASAIVTLADSFEGEKKLPEIMAECAKNASSQSQRKSIDAVMYTGGNYQTYVMLVQAARQFPDIFRNLNPWSLYEYLDNWQSRKKTYIKKYYQSFEKNPKKEDIEQFYGKISKKAKELENSLPILRGLDLNTAVSLLPPEAYIELCSVIYPNGYQYCSENIALLTVIMTLKKGSHKKKINEILKEMILSGKKDKVETLIKMTSRSQARQYLAGMLKAEETDPEDFMKVMTFWNAETKKNLITTVFYKLNKEETEKEEKKQND